jgi:hypothetical protein
VVSGSSANDYEINTTWSIKSGGGTYVLYLRANSSAVNGCTGSASYTSVEFSVPTNASGKGTWGVPMVGNQCTAGVLTTFVYDWFNVSDGISLRALIYDGSYMNTGYSGTNLCLIIPGNSPVCWMLSTGTRGQPGIGGSGMPSGSGFSAVRIGHHDVVAPNAVNTQSIATSVLPYQGSIHWQGVVDDPSGTGVLGYFLARSGGPQECDTQWDWDGYEWYISGYYCYYPTPNEWAPLTEIVDSTLQPGWTYTYQIQSFDEHFNFSALKSFTVTPPPANAVDPRRLGVRASGSYWGGGGEQIDMLSGNLNFSLALVSPQLSSRPTIILQHRGRV